MKRIYFLSILLSLLTPVLYAQDQKSFPTSELSVGAQYAMPLGDFREGRATFFDVKDPGYNYGIGGAVKYLLRLNKTYGFSLQTGAMRYHPKASATNTSGGFTAIPVKIGAQFRYRSLFAEPQFGFTYFADNHTFYQSGSTTYGLTIGSYITKHISLSANYERWNKGGFAASHVGVGVAYAFSLRGLHTVDSIMKERTPPPYRVRPVYDKTSEDWKTQRSYKALGWVSIGVGVPLTLLGLVTAIASTETNSIRPATYQWLIGSGVVVTSASIPFFILSHKYKKRTIRPL